MTPALEGGTLCRRDGNADARGASFETIASLYRVAIESSLERDDRATEWLSPMR